VEIDRGLIAFVVLGCLTLPCFAGNGRKDRDDSLSSYLQRVARERSPEGVRTSGSLWDGHSPFSNLAADYKARNEGDLVTINIAQQTLAEAGGAVDSQRTFSSKSGITGLAGRINTRGIDTLFSGSSDNKVQGKAQTSSNSRLRTSVTGQVVAVLPNGNLVVEARRQVVMNNEKETIVLRGITRPGDIASDNSVPSTQLSDLEIELKGKGAISDATRRPNWILRALLRLVTF
jgi:flagellar L-ring protein FlgH